MKRLAVAAALVAALISIPTAAGAVDGFSTPTYSPNSDPQIHQTEACNPMTAPAGAPCVRWVRQGGTFMQGPYSQAQHELALTYQECTFSQRFANGSGYYWAWLDATDFCLYTGTGHGGPWPLDK